MKWWSRTLLILMLIYAQLSQAEDVADSLKREAEKVLPQIRAELANKSLSNDKRYSLTILLARELLAAEFYTEAQTLYEEALKLETTETSPEPYINLTFIKKQKGTLTKSEATQTLAILKKNAEWKELSSEFEELYLLEASKPRSKPYQGFFGAYKNDISMRALIAEGRYAEALAFQGQVNAKHDILSKITFDLLSTIVKGPQKKLLCEEVMKKYPTSISYSMLLCRILIQKRQGQKIAESSLKALDEQIKRESPDKIYLEKLARELK